MTAGLAATIRLPSGARTLQIAGRIEGEVSATPYIYPTHNRAKSPAEIRFYERYQLGSRRLTAKVDGRLSEYTQQAPALVGQQIAGSGHPTGKSYVWLGNDNDYLYGGLDFTSDNTFDHDKDYASLVFNVRGQPKEFRVSVNAKAWGDVAFDYTDKVNYQHKTYEFKIPLSELDAKPTMLEKLQDMLGMTRAPREIQFAVMAYGTSTPFEDLRHEWAYNSTDNQFLMVYEYHHPSNDYDLRGQLLDGEGNAIGSYFDVATATGWQKNPAVAYNPVNNEYLVTYSDSRAGGLDDDLYGQRVAADVTLVGTTAAEGFLIADTPGMQIQKNDVAFATSNNRFLVVWEDYEQSPCCWGRIRARQISASGTVFPTIITLASDGSSEIYEPSVAYNADADKFAVVYADGRGGGLNDIGAAIVNADGTTAATNLLVVDRSQTTRHPDVAAVPGTTTFMTAFVSNGGDFFVQRFGSNGATIETSAASNFLVGNSTDLNVSLGLAYDVSSNTVIVAYPKDVAAVFQPYAAVLTVSPLGIASNQQVTTANIAAHDLRVIANTVCGGVLIGFADNSGDSGGNSEIRIVNYGVDCPEPPPAAEPSPAKIAVSQLVGEADGNTTMFGSVAIGQTVTAAIAITNAGGQALTLGQIANNNPLTAPFSISADTCSGQTLPANAGCVVELVFAPSVTDMFSDAFDIPSNDPTALLTLWGVEGYGAPPGNLPPPAPQLKRPVNGAVVKGNSVEFLWVGGADPDGDAVHYDLYYCTATDFTGCNAITVAEPVQTAAANKTVNWLWLAAVGLVLPVARRRATFVLAVALALTIGACNEKGRYQLDLGEGEALYAYRVNDLLPNSTYYWKVVAVDANGAEAVSEVWQFKTL